MNALTFVAQDFQAKISNEDTVAILTAIVTGSEIPSLDIPEGYVFTNVTSTRGGFFVNAVPAPVAADEDNGESDSSQS